MTIAPDALAVLRGRLIDMRADLVERMASDGVEPGFLHLLAGVGAANDVLDTPAVSGDAASSGRIVIADDGREIRIALYDPVGPVAEVPISPLRAITLAGELIAAASRRLR